jgi:DNA-binding NtrC family response regulator
MQVDMDSRGTASSSEASVDAFFSSPGQRIRARSIEVGGEKQAVDLVGLSPAFVDVLTKLEKVARYEEPVLVTGESGVGKEPFARTLHVLGHPKGPYVPVNCPQYQEGSLTVSELFGHVKGSFTGATTDHQGAFEQARGGVIFLDEIGDLPSAAQAMLLRTLSSGEFRPLGGTTSRSVNTRVVSATNRPLNHLVMTGGFRYDLFFRLRNFHLAIPPLRDRGDDWQLILEFYLLRLQRQYGVAKHFSGEALRMLADYDWPGNLRQVIGLVTTGYAMADGDSIELSDVEALLEKSDGLKDGGNTGNSRYDQVVDEGEDFWEVVYRPFLNRELNRGEVRSIISRGLTASNGSYRRLLELLHLPASDYQRFMDFLRHHDLKP